MPIYDYQQETKNKARHLILSQAVAALTMEREHICCIPRPYVRQVLDFFHQYDKDEPMRCQADLIEPAYITNWESLHDAIVGNKRPSDLSICYLSGPQPQNDFNELISLGVLPQNIWAFENNQATYSQAICAYNTSTFSQPKIIKMSVEQFFKHSPKKFDVVYIDACGTISSSQHALRSVATLLYYQRINSPGILITNFAKPSPNSEDDIDDLSRIIALYMLFKKTPNIQLFEENGRLNTTAFQKMYENVHTEFNAFYGEFITHILSDLAAVIIPLRRFGELAQYSNLFTQEELFSYDSKTELSDINQITNNSVCRWILTLDWLLRDESRMSGAGRNLKTLCADIVGLDGDWKQLVKGAKLFTLVKTGKMGTRAEIQVSREFFDSEENLYRFLDKATPSLFFDVVINQLTYPLHSNTQMGKAYQYCAKQTEMYTDMVALDECRYLYEWLPTIDQITNAMKNKSWQYVFRFALDALVKQRINYNNEFFFQGSVVSKYEPGFNSKERMQRMQIGENNG
ncbi:MAG: hypothetical protein PHO10_01150 [Gemmiger sp.]|nr:hypothetical protein [Gemmiger sp.]